MKKLVAALLMVPCMASAEFLDGNQIYQRMTSSDSGDRFYALGYIVGAYDMGVHVFFCPKNETGITAEEARVNMWEDAHRRTIGWLFENDYLEVK